MKQFLIDGGLVQAADGVFSAHLPAGAVVDAVQLFAALGGDHDDGTFARVAGEKNRVAGGFEGRAFEAGVAGGEGSRGAFAMDPGEAVVDHFLAGDVVADEVDQRAGRAGDDLLERFENQRVDQHVIDGREIRTEGHVVEIGIGLRRAQRRIDQFAVVAGKGNAPGGEMLLKGSELSRSQGCGRAAGAAMGEERDAAVFQAEGGGGGLGVFVLGDGDDFAFAEMVAAAVTAELLDFFIEGADCVS